MEPTTTQPTTQAQQPMTATLQMDPSTMAHPDQGQQPQAPAPVADGLPYFAGDHAVVKFSNGEAGYGPETYWLVEKSSKTLTPFVSMESLQNVFGSDFQQVLDSAATVAPPQMDETGKIVGGVFNNYYILGSEYAIQPDGSGKKLEFSRAQLAERYGKPINEQREQETITALEKLFEVIGKEAAGLGISPAFIRKTMSDDNLIAFWINAVTYGDYTIGDVYKDFLYRARKQDSSYNLQ